CAMMIVLLVRGSLVHVFSLKSLRRRLLIVGAGKKAAKLTAMIGRKLSHEATIVSGVRFPDEIAGTRRNVITASPAPGELLRLCRELMIDEIVVARDNQRGMPIAELLECRTHGIRIVDYISFLEAELGYIDINELRPSALVFSWGFNHS